MRIFFIGTVEFSLQALEKLVDIDANIVGVCTKESSTFNSDFANLSPICKINNIPYSYVEDINYKESFDWIKSLNPDIIFCFGWSSLIKDDLLKLTPYGVIGFHPASLPQNRGRHPIIWALALGLKETSSTFFFMNSGADSGDILSQEFVSITYEDNAKSLYDKIIVIALVQIEKFVKELINNSFNKIVQDDDLSNTWRKRGIKDGLIDFRMSSNAIYNLVRALTKPYVGSHIEYKDKHISIWKVEEVIYNHPNIESGKVLEVIGNKILVKSYDGAIRILKHDFNTLPKEGEYL
jgi:methionyl-tRNA formyltransferase